MLIMVYIYIVKSVSLPLVGAGVGVCLVVGVFVGFTTAAITHKRDEAYQLR